MPILAFMTAVIFGRWAATPIQSQFALHGVLAAVVASIIYTALTTAAGVPVPLLYHLSHGLRLLGGAAGGALAGRVARKNRVSMPPLVN